MADDISKIVRMCEVLSIDDPTESDRIKVRVMPEDNSVSTVEEIDYAFPALPKMFRVKPKVGECALVITAIANDGHSQRFYIGPVISQLNHLEKDFFNLGAQSLFRGSDVQVGEAPQNNPDAVGAYPKDDDVAVLGRRNTDIQLTNDDVRIKAGVKISNPSNRYDIRFNQKNPAYLKLKYHENKRDTDEYKSTATLVADKINLIGNHSKEGFVTTDKDDLITDAEMDKIIQKAHALPYGDVLIEFLDMIRKQLMNHTHPFPTKPPCSTAEMVQIGEYDLNGMLSESVKIN